MCQCWVSGSDSLGLPSRAYTRHELVVLFRWKALGLGSFIEVFFFGVTAFLHQHKALYASVLRNLDGRV